MRLTIILLTAAFLQASASGYSQTVTFSGKAISLQKAFTVIKNQTGAVFFYDAALIREAKPITVDLKDVPLVTALNEIFKDQPLTWIMENKTITIIKRPVQNDELTPTETIEFIPPLLNVTGRVVNENDDPVVGVTVTVKGTKNATATNNNGEFSLSGVDENATLVFTGVNVETYEIKVNGRTNLPTITLKTKVTLSETVVIGYGTAKRKDLTGSVASVSTAEIKDAPFTSIDQALSGKAAGVQVVQADGSPGGVARIRIRGGSSLLGKNDPLYIIDGVPVTIQDKYIQNAAEIVNPVETYYGEDFNNSVSGAFSRGLNSLAGLNINDIESIDILKDASATAIYGSKAANGVVIITTKKGKLNQKPTLDLNYYSGFTTALKEKVLNADQYKMIMIDGAKLLNQERARVGRAPNATATKIVNDPNFFGKANTDWLGLVLRQAFIQNADISVRGGGSGSRYYTSLSYTKQNGVLIGTDFQRLSGKINLDNEITSRLRVISNLDYGFSTNNITNGIYTQALYAPPTESPYNPDGSFSKLGAISSAYQGFQNPLAVASGINRAKNISLLGSLALEYDILKDLKFRTVASMNFNNYRQLNYVPSYVDIGGFYGRQSSGGGTGSQSTSNSTDAFFENTLTWNKEFNKDNRLNVVGGTSWEKYKSSFFSATGRGYPDDDFLNNLNSAAIPLSVKGSDPENQNSLLSFYLRANYAYKDKYLLTFTGRSDASSKFAPNNQVGYFPSGAVAWMISEEKFMKKISWIDELKLRVSAGTTGTENIGDNLWRTLYTPVTYAGANALIPSQLGNEKLKWESTLQKDLGLDFSLFKSRLRGTFGYYEKITDGLLLNITTAPSSAYGSIILNIAKIRNRGLEMDLRGDIIRNKNFQWNAALNISRNVSKVLDINGGPFSNPNDRDALNLGTSVVKEGEPLGLLYGATIKGVITTQKQLDDYKAAFPFYVYIAPYLNIGDLEYELDNTNGFAYYHQDVIGNANPKFYGGFTNSFSYKNFSLVALLTFSYGNELMYQNDVSNHYIDNLANRGVSILDHYSATNTNSNWPRLIYSVTNPFVTNRNIYDASYIKLKTITLSYELPRAIATKLKFRNASVYFTGTNLFTITSYPGLDPEVSDDPNSVIGGGRDVSSYPTTRGFIAGLRLGF
ncbi:MAG: TonB-dependent receptor [Bacteroidetes bacterium]|nr:TonB-dependent receptor [Bacteroidota bacterium]MBS1929649.1 TonB-dependent receptor [Bacteroidota bacterium]